MRALLRRAGGVGYATAVIHYDFRADNLLVTANDGLIVMDWQTIKAGLPELDFVEMLAAERRLTQSALRRSVLHFRQSALDMSCHEAESSAGYVQTRASNSPNRRPTAHSSLSMSRAARSATARAKDENALSLKALCGAPFSTP